MKNRIIETAVFCIVVLAASIAVIALAIAAPVILGLTAISGILFGGEHSRRWRSVSARA
ncbi:hypothetical protein [Hyphococcus sp.]|uniref:hypothetical protein n=1 Tax=Hyphococcus sp. TaxID=2038636 RepID=UPI003CCBA092